MFFAIKGNDAYLKCNECKAHFSVGGFWPPKTQMSVECPECWATAQWVWEKKSPEARPDLFLKWNACEDLNG